MVVCLPVFCASCIGSENPAKGINSGVESLDNNSHKEHSDEDKDRGDAFVAHNSAELIQLIGSNRTIQLLDRQYEFKSTLVIDSINNLKIVGSGSSELKVKGESATVLALVNSQNIYLDKLIIVDNDSQWQKGESGNLRVSQSSNIHIANCKISGSGTFGLVTFDVSNLLFENSEISQATGLIFELGQTRKCTFRNSKFHNNNLSISVLGAFTDSTQEVSFMNCEFLNNLPEMAGNPAFNFYNNLDESEEKVVFTNCIFKNNKGYKWYGDYIKLENCTIDSSDFVGLQSKD